MNNPPVGDYTTFVIKGSGSSTEELNEAFARYFSHAQVQLLCVDLLHYYDIWVLVGKQCLLTRGTGTSALSAYINAMRGLIKIDRRLFERHKYCVRHRGLHGARQITQFS